MFDKLGRLCRVRLRWNSTTVYKADRRVASWLSFFPNLHDVVLSFRLSVATVRWLPVPSTLPAFIGSLELTLPKGIGAVGRRLPDLPNGLRFRRLILVWLYHTDIRWTNKSVALCSDTLECLDTTHFPSCTIVSKSLAGPMTYSCL